MSIKSILLGLGAALFATASLAGRGSDGNVSIIYWQAPSILNPYLSGGTKDIESSSMIIEPLARYNETGALVPFLAEEVPTVGNGGVSADLKSITWKLKKTIPQDVKVFALAISATQIPDQDGKLDIGLANSGSIIYNTISWILEKRLDILTISCKSTMPMV